MASRLLSLTRSMNREGRAGLRTELAEETEGGRGGMSWRWSCRSATCYSKGGGTHASPMSCQKKCAGRART
jgi:hypothetical protein